MFEKAKEEIVEKGPVVQQKKCMSKSNESCYRGAVPVARMSTVSNQSALTQLNGNKYPVIQRMEESDEDKKLGWFMEHFGWFPGVPSINSFFSSLSQIFINPQVPVTNLPMPAESSFPAAGQPPSLVTLEDIEPLIPVLMETISGGNPSVTAESSFPADGLPLSLAQVEGIKPLIPKPKVTSLWTPEPPPLPAEIESHNKDVITRRVRDMLIAMLKHNYTNVNSDLLIKYEGDLKENFQTNITKQFFEANQLLEHSGYEAVLNRLFMDPTIQKEMQTFHDTLKTSRTSPATSIPVPAQSPEHATQQTPEAPAELAPEQLPEELAELAPYEIVDGKIKRPANFQAAFKIEFTSSLDVERNYKATPFMYKTMPVSHESHGKDTDGDAKPYSTILVVLYQNKRYVVGFMHHIGFTNRQRAGLQYPAYKIDAILPGITFNKNVLKAQRSYGFNNIPEAPKDQAQTIAEQVVNPPPKASSRKRK